MVTSPFGQWVITHNGKRLVYDEKALNLTTKQFDVEARYQVCVEIPQTVDNIIESIIDIGEFRKYNYSKETGEGLALISFISDTIKICMGVEGDIYGVSYEYLKKGIRVSIPKEIPVKSISMNIAWKKIEDDSRDYNQVWLASDPNSSY